MRRHRKFPELSYANEQMPFWKRAFIRTVEDLSGRNRLADLYDIWRTRSVGHSSSVMGDMLELIDVDVKINGGQWPPKRLPDAPLVLIANHPYGIGDGIAILALAEQVGRPFRVMINSELMKVPEIRPYSLPVSFEETREATKMNLATKKEALRLLDEGVTIVVFPAGGVATAEKGFGRAFDLPWKNCVARLVQSAEACVVPIFFEGQNGRMFHLASKIGLTARRSLLVREFARLRGGTLSVHIGAPNSPGIVNAFTDRNALMKYLQTAVFSLAPVPEDKPRLRIAA
ncbi:MAG: lysophospholipid acyltransferase family protein [Pseudomonadota bacterium]